MTDIVAEPVIVGGDLVVRTSLGDQTISVPGAEAVSIEAAVMRSSMEFSLAGPWRIGYSTSLSTEDLETALQSYPDMSAALARLPAVEVIGELTASIFPDPARTDFYDGGQASVYLKSPDSTKVHPLEPAGWVNHNFGDYDIDLPQAWAITKGDSNVIVAVVDVGVNIGHPEFDGRILNTDPIGDANSDGCPGDCYVDDDGDGLVDEDYKYRDRSNRSEYDGVDLTPGTFVTGMGTSITISTNRAWSADELLGWRIYVVPEERAYSIDGNLAAMTPCDGNSSAYCVTLTTSGAMLGDWSLIPSELRASNALILGNNIDDDGDGIIDDLGWNPEFNLADDDENGKLDDYAGWDFYDNDNDVTNEKWHHGTGIAGLIAATFDSGSMVGIAPNVKILPIKAAPDLSSCGDKGGVFLSEEIVEYCAQKGATILVTAQAADVYSTDVAASVIATDEFGMIHTNGAGNAAIYGPHNYSANPRAIIVGGIEQGGWPWYNEASGQGTRWHESIELSANAVQWGPRWGSCYGTERPYRGWEGTSFSGPAVAGVIALMKSAYPQWDADFIRAKVIASTTPIFEFGERPVMNVVTQQTGANGETTIETHYQGNLGSGAVNAYRALTYYGDLFPNDPVADTVVTWSGTIYVSGDLHVPAWQHLDILPGTTIKIAQDDITDGGVDPRIVEWVVDGSLSAVGTPGNPIVFEVLADDPADFPPDKILAHNPQQLWGYFKYANADDITMSNVEFRDMIPQDTASIGRPNVGAVGQTIDITWTTDNVFPDHNPSIRYEDNVRIRTSMDNGATYDAGIVVPFDTGVYSWPVPTGGDTAPVAIRVELMDANSKIFAVSEFFKGTEFDVITPLPAFANVSAATGMTIPQGSNPYASAPMDYNDDGSEDLLISYTDRAASLYKNGGPSGDIAFFDDRKEFDLGGGSLGSTRGVNRIDYNNDGVTDVFLASATGSMLFKGNPFVAGDMTEDVSSLLGAAGASASNSAAWGDYNADGYIDAYILQDSGDVLLESTVSSGGGFVDVTVVSGLHTDATSTNSAMWAHLNSDGYLDLFVGWGTTADGASPTLAWSPYYINNGENGAGQFTFTDTAGASSGPRIGYLGNIHAVDFADISGDGFLDIVLARQSPAGSDPFGNLVACINDGTGAMTVEGGTLGIHTDVPMQDLEVSDIDGNGVPDLIGVPSDGSAVQVYTGFGEDVNRSFWDATSAAGLGTGTTYGVATADFNGDSDHDVFLLRPETGSTSADKQFMWANPLLTAAPATGSEVTMTVGFDTPIYSLNAFGLGATVTVIVDTPSGHHLVSSQVVDGGSGRGSQGSGRLAFGLGGASTAAIHVKWPHGGKQVFDAASMPGFPNVIVTDTTDPQIDNSTITASYTPANGNTTHTFQWYTLLPGGEPQVKVQAGGRATSNCLVPLNGGSSLILDPDNAGVTATSEKLGSVWRHTVVWQAYCEAPCTYTYTVRNNVGGTIYSGNVKTHFVGVCADIQQ